MKTQQSIEDAKEADLLKLITDRIVKFRADLQKMRIKQPWLAQEILALDKVLLDAEIDFPMIARLRSERRASEAPTKSDMLPFKDGHRTLDEIVTGHQSSDKIIAQQESDQQVITKLRERMR